MNDSEHSEHSDHSEQLDQLDQALCLLVSNLLHCACSKTMDHCMHVVSALKRHLPRSSGVLLRLVQNKKADILAADAAADAASASIAAQIALLETEIAMLRNELRQLDVAG